MPARAAGTVGTGTQESCTETAFDAALVDGMGVTFDCGGPATITLTGTKVISVNTQIDGDGLITLSGGNGITGVRLFTVDLTATLSLSNITIANGYASGEHGGAILVNDDASLAITNSTFSSNRTVGGYGGAIYVAGGTLDITDSLFINNSADVDVFGPISLGGGAIQNNDGKVTISGSTFSGNSVIADSADGGAIYNGDFDGDPATETPDAYPDELTITNSTFYNNSLVNDVGGSSGGAVRSSGILTITHSTFSNNDSGVTQPGAEAGAVAISWGTATLTNNIFANSTGADCAARSTVTSLTSTGNLIEQNYPGSRGCGTPAKTADPDLGPLQDNGGPTPTMALSGQSPAVNALSACAAGKDQRGISRPQPDGENCDIGAYELEAPPPTVSNVTAAVLNASYGTESSIPITVTFNENVVVTGMPLITLETGATDRTAVYLSGSGSDTLTFIYTVQAGDTSSDLDYVSTNSIALNGGTIQDGTGKPANLNLPNPGGPGSLAGNKDIVIDTSVPSLTSFTRQSPATSPTNANSLVFRATFSEAVNNVNTADFAVNGATTATVTNVATVDPFTYDITLSGGDLTGFNGAVGIDLKPGQNIEDLLGNPLPTSEPATDQGYTLDNILPGVDTIVRASTNPTNASLVRFTVTFTESVTGVDIGDFGLTTDGVSGASVVNRFGSGSTYTLEVFTGSGGGTLQLDLIANGTIRDTAGNDLAGSHTGDESYTIDRALPFVSSIVRAGLSPTNASSVDFTVTFSETVTQVDAGDFNLTTGGAVSGAVVTAVSGTGATRTVTVGTGTGDGTIRLDLIDDNTIVDAVGNPLGGFGPNNGSFTTGETYTITKPASVNVRIKEKSMGDYSILSGAAILGVYDGEAQGPVRVKSTNDVPIFTSQRAAYGSSFNELMGFPANQLTTDYWFTYYDNINMSTWLMIGVP